MDGGDKRESPDSSAQSKSPRTLRNSMHGNRETSGRLRRKRRQTGGKRRKAIQPACTQRRSRTEVKYQRVARTTRRKPRRRARREDLGSRRTPARSTRHLHSAGRAGPAVGQGGGKDISRH